MAHQPLIGAVVGHADGTPWALRHLPAVHAHQGAAVAPAVQEQNGLLSVGPGIIDGLPQRIAQGKVISQLHFLPHVHDFHLRQGAAVVAVFQAVEGVIPVFRPVHTLDAGGRGTKHHQSFFL